MFLRVQLEKIPNLGAFKIYKGGVNVEVDSMQDAFIEAVDLLKTTVFPDTDYEDWKLNGIEILDEEDEI